VVPDKEYDKMEKRYGFATLTIHGKRHLDKHESGVPIRAISTPIFQSSTFAFETAEQGAALFSQEQEGFIYTRLGNPTTRALEIEMAYLEKGEEALAFGSGMAATSTSLFPLLRPGDNVVASDTLYGGTHALFMEIFPKLGLEAREVDGTDVSNIESACDDRTKVIFIETPANPTLYLIDIEACAKLASKKNLHLMVDNTFLTPYYQNPIELGAHSVIHSATKYIGGHGDTVAGLVVGSREFIHRVRDEFLIDLGGIISPFNAWLLLRGLKTLPVRMDKHSENAMEIAQFLNFHPKVEKVYYPGLRTHPQYELAGRQMRGYGGMIAFELKGGRAAGRSLLNNLELMTIAVSLGDVDTLISHPASMTHSTYSEEELAKAGISEGLVRLSVGLEDVDDLVFDLRQALKKV
jgi:methionine-gamma-lyase